MRTKEQIKSDFEILMSEITPLIDSMGDTGAPQFALYSVLDARPELKKRFDALVNEAKEIDR